MNKLLRVAAIVMIAAVVGITTANAQRGEPRAPSYKITNIKIVPFNEATGKFEDEIIKGSERSFFNDLSISLFVTFEVSGKAGSFEVGRKIAITVTEGKKIKLTRSEQVGLIGSDGKYFVPIFLYSSMCSTVTIRARLSGQTTASTTSRKVPFLCGE